MLTLNKSNVGRARSVTRVLICSSTASLFANKQHHTKNLQMPPRKEKAKTSIPNPPYHVPSERHSEQRSERHHERRNEGRSEHRDASDLPPQISLSSRHSALSETTGSPTPLGESRKN